MSKDIFARGEKQEAGVVPEGQRPRDLKIVWKPSGDGTPANPLGIGPNSQATVSLGDQSVGGLIQAVNVSLNATDMLPQLSLLLIPGGLDILIEKGLINLQELVAQRIHCYDLYGGTHLQQLPPFPVNREELMNHVAIATLARAPDKRPPTHIHMPAYVWDIFKHRSGDPDPVPFKILGMSVDWMAKEFKLEWRYD